MALRNTVRLGPYSNTITVFVLAVLLVALAITIKSMQKQTHVSQYASSDCIIPPTCMIEHTCVLPQPTQGWCQITPSLLSPTLP